MTQVWPETTTFRGPGVEAIGGVDVRDLARAVGTPTLVYDVATMRAAARQFTDGFAARYPKGRVVFAGKAFLCTALVDLLRACGLGLDVVSGGELALGLAAGMPAAEMSFHGNNKGEAELREAIAAGVGKIVIDNEDEIDLLARLTARLAEPVRVMLRLNPGVDVHTHRKISTGIVDSKFGFPIGNGQAAAAAASVAAIPTLRLVGYHCHVGSQLFEAAALVDAIGELLAFAAAMKREHGMELEHLSPGGGFGIAYLDSDTPLAIDDWMTAVAEAIIGGCERHGHNLPTVTIEPGRAIVGPAGVSIYTVGASKAIAGVRTYVAVDGGMADNIRPTLYDARYTAALVGDPGDRASQTVTIAGKYCESGDLLIEDIALPALVPGDLLAIPATGAYCYAMASNYNYATRPAVVFVEEGAATVVRRRETYEDLRRLDVTEPVVLASQA